MSRVTRTSHLGAILTANDQQIKALQRTIQTLPSSSGGGGAVDTINGIGPNLAGDVTLRAVDVSADPIGTAATLFADADPLGSAANALTTAESFATSAIALALAGALPLNISTSFNLAASPYVPQLADAFNVIAYTGTTTDGAVHIPPSSSVPWVLGTVLTFWQIGGSGQINVTAQTGAVTVNCPGGATNAYTQAQWYAIQAWMYATDLWVLMGALGPNT